jgi:hypothetical protein
MSVFDTSLGLIANSKEFGDEGASGLVLELPKPVKHGQLRLVELVASL